MNNLDRTLQQDVEKTMGTIFLNVLFNWNSIKEIPHVMSCLDMNTNSLCRQLKQNDPTQRDGFIQAHVLSFLILMMYIMNITTQTIVRCSSNLLGNAIINSAAHVIMQDSNQIQHVPQNQHIPQNHQCPWPQNQQCPHVSQNQHIPHIQGSSYENIITPEHLL